VNGLLFGHAFEDPVATVDGEYRHHPLGRTSTSLSGYA
jgi:hypothetical protein